MFIKKIACSSADADATLVGRDETSADAEGSIFPLPPAAEAVEDTDTPTDVLAAALQVPEVGARIAAAASVLLVGGAATTAGLAASDADPMAASAPLEIGVPVGSDVLEDPFGRNLGVEEQRTVLQGSNCIDMASGRCRPLSRSTADFWSHARRSHLRDTPIWREVVRRTRRFAPSLS
jgi:hypothetical protein